jgi:hypothetical protein
LTLEAAAPVTSLKNGEAVTFAHKDLTFFEYEIDQTVPLKDSAMLF